MLWRLCYGSRGSLIYTPHACVAHKLFNTAPQIGNNNNNNKGKICRRLTRILCLMTTMVPRLLALVASVNAFASRPIDEKIALLIIDTQVPGRSGG